MTNEQAETVFVIEEVRYLDASWPEMRGLFLDFEEYNQAFEPRELLQDWEDRLRSRFRLHDDRLVLMARASGSAAGCLIGGVRRNEGLARDIHCYLSYVFVREGLRNLGIGTKLLERAEVWSVGKGASHLELDVLEGNHLGYGFWSQAGFSTHSRTMRKTLEARA